MDLREFSEKAGKIGALGIQVSQEGALIGEWYSEGECRRNVYSASKSFTCCAVGFAVQEGLLSLSERLVDVFRKELPDEVGEFLEQATVRDLLTMRLGQKEASLMGEQRPFYAEDDWVKLSLGIPFVYVPDTQFVYNNVGPYLAGVLVQRRSGCDLVSYLIPRFFSHLGIKRPTWEVDPLGYTFGAGGLFLSLTELHKFGQFCLNGGSWDGKQLLSSEWMKESTRQQGPDPYGYLFWRGNHNSYRADGKYGQFSIVFEDKQAVVSVVSECRQTEMLKNYIDTLVYPQF